MSLDASCVKTDREFVAMAVYASYEPQEEAAKEQWDENLDTVAWLIRRMAEKYMDGKGAYNSYKHGLRVMTGESWLKIATQDQEGTHIIPFLYVVMDGSVTICLSRFLTSSVLFYSSGSLRKSRIR